MAKIEALEGELFLYIDVVQLSFNGPNNNVLVIAKATREIEKKYHNICALIKDKSV